MAVITISRGSFSGGKALAECLARRLGSRCIDRDIITERAAAHSVSPDEIRKALEKPPTFLERFQHKRYLYLALVQAALAEEVRSGNAVYHGLAGHLLLKAGPVLRTRLIAPMELRIQAVVERLKYSRNEAIFHIAKVDEDRRRWTQFLYGVDWGDASLYDLVINLEHFTIDQACQMIISAAKERCLEFTPECQQKMDDLALASRLRADLALNPATADLELEVAARKGTVSIGGKVATLGQIEEISRFASSFSGVASLNLDKLRPIARA
jgi:cytidylate kinase